MNLNISTVVAYRSVFSYPAPFCFSVTKFNIFFACSTDHSSNLLRWSFRRNREQYAQSVKCPQWHLDLPARQSDTTIIKNSFQEKGLLNGSLSSALRLWGEARSWRVSFISSSLSKTSGCTLITFLFSLVGIFDPVTLKTLATVSRTSQADISTLQTFHLIIPKFFTIHEYQRVEQGIYHLVPPNTVLVLLLFLLGTTAYSSSSSSSLYRKSDLNGFP